MLLELNKSLISGKNVGTNPLKKRMWETALSLSWRCSKYYWTLPCASSQPCATHYDAKKAQNRTSSQHSSQPDIYAHGSSSLSSLSSTQEVPTVPFLEFFLFFNIHQWPLHFHTQRHNCVLNLVYSSVATVITDILDLKTPTSSFSNPFLSVSLEFKDRFPLH